MSVTVADLLTAGVPAADIEGLLVCCPEHPRTVFRVGRITGDSIALEDDMAHPDASWSKWVDTGLTYPAAEVTLLNAVLGQEMIEGALDDAAALRRLDEAAS